MVSWKELRELIVLYYDMKVLNDAEYLLLYDLYSPQNLDLPCDLYPHFDLQNLTEDECVAEFRFRTTDIPRLSQALRIPDVIICHQGTIFEGTEGLCMLLKRLCYPFPIQRYGPLVRQAGSCIVYDYKSSFGLYLSSSQPSHSVVESSATKPSQS